MAVSAAEELRVREDLPYVDFEADFSVKLRSPYAKSHGSSPPSTGTSTPCPSYIAGTGLRSSGPVSNGSATPPDRERMQNLIETLEQTRRMPLKPGPLEGSSKAWSLPLSEPLSPTCPPPPAPIASSKGSLGHPHMCAEACKYVKRKTGCLLGSACPQCHLCFWQRRSAPAPSAVPSDPKAKSEGEGFSCVAAFSGHNGDCATTPTEPAAQTSLGSVGHPHCCAAPCRYVRRKGGCINGSSCPECHICHWQRNPQKATSEIVGAKTETGYFDIGARERLEHLIETALQIESNDPVKQAPNTNDATLRLPSLPPHCQEDSLSNPLAVANHAFGLLVRLPPGLDNPPPLSQDKVNSMCRFLSQEYRDSCLNL
jgi:hypothetical protein